MKLKRIIITVLIVAIGLNSLLPMSTSGYLFSKDYEWKYSCSETGRYKDYYNVKINGIIYDISFYGKESTACVKYADKKGSTLKIPLEIKFKGKNVTVESVDIHDSKIGETYGGKWQLPYKVIYLPESAVYADFITAKLSNKSKLYVPEKTKFLSGCQNYSKLNIIIDEKNPYIKMKNGAIYSKDGTQLFELVNSKKKYKISKGTKDVFLSNNKKIVTVIFPESGNLYFDFQGCSNLKNVKLNKDLKVISSLAFNNCKSLKKINIPKKTKTIEHGAFENCKNLSDIKINTNGKLQTIESCSFMNCKSLKEISLPKNVKKIDFWAFKDCINLEKVKINNTKSAPKFVGSGVFENTKDGIKFIVKNQTIADHLSEQLKNSGARNAKVVVKG